MNKIAILILIAFNWIPLSAKIPLQQAITRGIQKSLVIQNNLLEQKNLKLEKKTRDMKKWLTLHLGGSYIFKSQQMEINFLEIQINEGISVPLEPIIVGARHNYDLKLGLSQPIYTGNRLSNSAKLKDIQYEMEKHNTGLNTIEVSTRIKTSYFTYRMLFYQQQSVNAFLETLQLHQRKLEDFYLENLIKKSDLLETEFHLQEQMMNLEEIKLRIAREKINFKSLCDFNIEDISGDYTETIEPGPELLSDFQNHHPYLQMLNAQIRLLEIQKRLTNAEYLPQLVGFAEIHYGRPGIDYFTNEWSLYFQGGIGFDLKLFDWNQRKRNQKILNYSQEKSRNKQKDFSREVENQVRQLLESKKAIEIKLAIIGNLIEISREDTELKAELFQEQQITNKDYLASLATKERYVFMEKEQQLQIEMIKVNINKWLGLFDRKF
ncbi:MAG: TolC family protein [Candidatus Aminicenantes bacterium]|nr:TolC family protein [Candidatus Aminicenantes bacterium]